MGRKSDLAKSGHSIRLNALFNLEGEFSCQWVQRLTLHGNLFRSPFSNYFSKSQTWRLQLHVWDQPCLFSRNLFPMADGTKNPTLHDLKQHKCIFSFSYRSEISISRTVSPPKSYTAEISVRGRLSSFLKILGMNPLPATFALLAEFHAMWLRFPFPWWLLALDCPRLPEDLSITHLLSPSSVFKTTVAASTPFNYPHFPSTLLVLFYFLWHPSDCLVSIVCF